MWQLANYNHSTILRLYGECGGMALDILLIFCMLLLCKCNCNCNLAHESLAFPFVFCNYALSWIVVDVVAVLLLALQASSFAFNYCSHFSNFSPSVLRCRLCNTALSLSSVSAICISPTVVCIYLQPNLRRAAPTLCSLYISLCRRGCICCHVPRFIFPSRWELCWESSLRNWRSPP